MATPSLIADTARLRIGDDNNKENNSLTLSSDVNLSADASVNVYKSNRFVGHSLWLVPTGEALNAYDDIIGHTALELDTFHFLPHVTLVGALSTPLEEIMERTRDLASQIAPYEFEFEDLSQRDAFFQCVFATMKLTDPVLRANELARQAFEEKQKDAPYMPHLSMIYGDFSEEQKTNDFIPKLREQIKEREAETRSFPVDAIEIWNTTGDVEDWFLVERIPLTGCKTLEYNPEDDNDDSHLELAQ